MTGSRTRVVTAGMVGSSWLWETDCWWTGLGAGVGTGERRQELLICTLWLCPQSWTFQHFTVFINALTENRGQTWDSKWPVQPLMWDRTNRMRFNGNKCDALHLGPENQLYKYSRWQSSLRDVYVKKSCGFSWPQTQYELTGWGCYKLWAVLVYTGCIVSICPCDLPIVLRVGQDTCVPA